MIMLYTRYLRPDIGRRQRIANLFGGLAFGAFGKFNLMYYMPTSRPECYHPDSDMSGLNPTVAPYPRLVPLKKLAPNMR